MMDKPSSPSFARKALEHLMPLVILLGALASGLALLSYAVLGFFSRYYADDYCMSGMILQKGFWPAQVEQYVTWSNRYAGMFALSASELFGRMAIRGWTFLVLLLLALALTWALFQLDRWLNWSLSGWLLVLLAELVVLFTLLFAPELYQSLFWRVGVITYTLPLAFLAGAAGLVIYGAARTAPGRIPWMGAAACFLLTLFASGFSETYVALQTALFLAGVAAAYFLARHESRRNWLALLLASALGSLLGLALVLASPGNAVRQAAMPSPPGLVALARMAFTHAFLFMYRTLAASAFQTWLAVLIPLLLVYGFYANVQAPAWRPSRLILALLLAPAACFAAIAVVMAPAAYAQSSYPDGRVLIEAGFLMAVLLTSAGALTGAIFSQLHRWAGEGVPWALRGLVALLAAVLLLYPLYDARRNAALLPEYQARAASWDARDERIRAARQSGVFAVTVKGFNAPGGLAEFQVNPGDWVNQCAATFYDVKSLQAGGQ